MLQGFTGKFPQKVDGKGRMSVPAAFRRVLESQDPSWADGLPVKMHINYGKHLKHHLRVYSVQGMQAILDDIAELDIGTREKAQLARFYLGQTDEVTMDKDGRVVLPQRLRESLGVDNEAELTLMGMGENIEIWQAEMFETVIGAEQDAFLAELGEGVDPLSVIAKHKRRA